MQTTPLPPIAGKERHIMAFDLPGMQMLRATWQYRGFIRGMVAREFRTRYLNSLLGSLWAILNPLAMIVIYTVIFSRIMGARLPGVDDTFGYSLYLCAGLLPWTYFTEIVLRSQTLFLEHANLIKKVSFPRTTLPVIMLISATINFAIIFALFLMFLVTAGRFPGWSIAAFIPLLVLQQAFALGMGVFLGTLNVFFRDIGHLVGIGLQFWFWFTPIVYSVASLSDRLKALFAWNPMTAFVTAYQEIVLHRQWPDWTQFGFHLAITAALVALALLAFVKLSADMTDEL